MKNVISHFLLLALLLAAVSCRTAPAEIAERPTTVFSAMLGEDGTKTTLTDDFKTVWSKGDAIRIFSPSCPNGETFTVDSTCAGSRYATFTGFSIGSGPYFAVYPAAAALSYDGSSVTVDLPSTQTYAPGSFADGASITVCRSDTAYFHMRNLCGALRLQLTGTASVTSVSLTSGDVLCGKASVTFDENGIPSAALTAGEDGSHTITLQCPEAVTLSQDKATAFHFIVPAGTLAGGFTMSAADTKNGKWEKTAVAAERNTVARSEIKLMSPCAYVRTASPFLSETAYGVYDLSDPAEPKAVRTYVKKKDQYATRRSSKAYQFRIQNYASSQAIVIDAPVEAEEYDEYTINVTSVGVADVKSAKNLKVRLEKVDGARRWYVDDEGKTGYIIQK